MLIGSDDNIPITRYLHAVNPIWENERLSAYAL
jgi:hypothetical protein